MIEDLAQIQLSSILILSNSAITILLVTTPTREYLFLTLAAATASA